MAPKLKTRISPSLYGKTVSTKEMAYILGLAWADGNLEIKPSKSRHCLKFMMNKEDLSSLLHVFDAIGTYRLYDVRNTYGKPLLSLQIVDKAFAYFLLEYDYYHKSSPAKILSLIPSHLRHYWWRGYSDGDGSWRKAKQNVFCFNIAGPVDENWNEAESICQQLGIEYYISKRISSVNHRNSLFVIGKLEEIKKWAKYIYTEDNNICLQRKRAIAMDILNTTMRPRQNPYRYVLRRGPSWYYKFQIGKDIYHKGGFKTPEAAYEACLQHRSILVKPKPKVRYFCYADIDSPIFETKTKRKEYISSSRASCAKKAFQGTLLHPES